MKVLVTGSAGMVGSNLLPVLEACNHLSILAPSKSELNLLDQSHTRDYLQTTKPDLIIHLAAKVGGIQENIRYPVEFFSENLLIGFNLMMTARETGIKQLLNVSSASIYQALDQSFNSTSKKTNEAYALAKLSVLRLGEFISQEYHLHYKSIIPCNLYGPYDNFDLMTGHMIPATLHKLHLAKIKKESEVTIWGDGEAKREFMYVGDLVDFLLFAINNFDKLPATTNVGLGYQYSINEYYQLLNEIVGFEGKFTHDLTKPTGGKMPALAIDALNQLGWRATISFQEGAKKTYDYFLKKGLM